MSEPARAVRIADLPSVSDPITWHPVRGELGVEAFGVNAFAAAAGELLIEDHDETTAAAGHHQELYVVLSGRARFTVDGEAIDVPAGTAVFVPDPESRRVATAVEDGTLALVVGGRVGEAYAPSAWEASALAAAFLRRGDVERGRRYRAEALASHGDHAHALYNVACSEALDGEHEAALEHLRRAVELEPRSLEWARADADLDGIRDDPRFPRV